MQTLFLKRTLVQSRALMGKWERIKITSAFLLKFDFVILRGRTYSEGDVERLSFRYDGKL